MFSSQTSNTLPFNTRCSQHTAHGGSQHFAKRARNQLNAWFTQIHCHSSSPRECKKITTHRARVLTTLRKNGYQVNSTLGSRRVVKQILYEGNHGLAGVSCHLTLLF